MSPDPEIPRILSLQTIKKKAENKWGKQLTERFGSNSEACTMELGEEGDNGPRLAADVG